MEQAPAKSETASAPSALERAWSLAAALAAFVADGCRTLDRAGYEQRLRICDTCDQRDENVCRRCGCFISAKALWRVGACPLGKWPSTDPVQTTAN